MKKGRGGVKIDIENGDCQAGWGGGLGRGDCGENLVILLRDSR